MGLLSDLQIPTLPGYDFAADPAEQAEYANPVTVSNKQVQLANAALAVAGKLAVLNRQLAKAKQDLEVAEAQLDDFELGILGTREPAASDRKSNRLLQVYIRRLAHEQGGGLQAYQMLVNAVRNNRVSILGLQGEIDNYKHIFFTIKLVGEHGQTYLSWCKDDARRRGFGA